MEFYTETYGRKGKLYFPSHHWYPVELQNNIVHSSHLAAFEGVAKHGKGYDQGQQ